jgi:hypothetical protein
MLGVTLSGEANRETPAQAELRPTCAEAPGVNLLCKLALPLETQGPGAKSRLKPQAESYSPSEGAWV